MRPILMDNAFESWAAAIRYCNDIKDGKATLQYQKNFVSSLHNAVELIMKQMLLNNNDHSVAELRKPKNEAEAKLLLDYYKASDLNRFFESLSDDELLKFYTIPFNELISSHKKIFGDSLKSGETLKTELELLQRLRNDETHFMIRQDSFLSEGDFRTLHNFMVRFYKIIKKWNPVNGDDLESSIFIWWYWYSPDKDDSMYEFECELLQDFSYESAVRNSKLAKEIAEILKDNHQCGAPDFSPYDIAFDLMNGYPRLSAQFDEVWAMVYMMQSLGMIVVEDILDDDKDEFIIQCLFYCNRFHLGDVGIKILIVRYGFVFPITYNGIVFVHIETNVKNKPRLRTVIGGLTFSHSHIHQNLIRREGDIFRRAGDKWHRRNKNFFLQAFVDKLYARLNVAGSVGYLRNRVFENPYCRRFEVS